jgi:hypothetical protein
MSLLKNLKTDDSIQDEKDTLGGARVLESGIYPMTIDMAFISKSAGGALGLNLHCDNGNGQSRFTLWVTSGDAKGNQNFYTNPKGEKQYLPGFNQANAISLLTLGKEISELDTEEKVINLYDSTAGKEVPTKVNAVMELLKQEVLMGIIKQTVNKNVKSGDEYVATAETRDENEINKIFRAKDGLTVADIKSGATESVFLEQWKAKWEGVTKDKTVAVASTGAVAGAPTAASAAKSLFK